MNNYLGSVIAAAAERQGRTPSVPLRANERYPARKHIIFREACGHKELRTPKDICWRENTPVTCTRCYQKLAADTRRGKGPKQIAALQHANEIVALYRELSISKIAIQLGMPHRVVLNILRERDIEILSAKMIQQRKYRSSLPAVEGHLHAVQPERWNERGCRLYECHGPSHFEPSRVWRKAGQHTACNRNCARQRHTFSDLDSALRTTGCTKVRFARHGPYIRDSVVSYICPHDEFVEQAWPSLVRAVMHGKTVCPHVDKFLTERIIRFFVRRAIPRTYSVAVGPISVNLRGGKFFFDIAVLKDGIHVAYIEPGSHQTAVRYGGMSQRAANKSLLKIQRNDKRKKRWAAKRKIPLLQLETRGKRLNLIFEEVWHWLQRRRLTNGIKPSVSYGDVVREVPYGNELRKVGLSPGNKRWEALCLKCGLQFRYYRQARRDRSDIHCPKCRGGVGKHGRTRKAIEARAAQLGVKFELPSGESFNEDVHGKSECVQCGEDTTASVADLFRSNWSKKCKRCAMSRKAD